MTDYSEIFQAFTAKISDEDRAALGDEVAEQDSIDLLNSAIFHFRLPHIPLTKNDTTLTFDNTLGNDEIQILATLMKVEWYKRQIYNLDVTQQKYAEHDFEFKSQASHLKALLEGWSKLAEKESKRMLSDYSRTPGHKVFDYTRLAGKKK